MEYLRRFWPSEQMFPETTVRCPMCLWIRGTISWKLPKCFIPVFAPVRLTSELCQQIPSAIFDKTQGKFIGILPCDRSQVPLHWEFQIKVDFNPWSDSYTCAVDGGVISSAKFIGGNHFGGEPANDFASQKPKTDKKNVFNHVNALLPRFLTWPL